jgi:hypothetical protein
MEHIFFIYIYFLGTAEVRPVAENTAACATHKLTYFIEKQA